jgi:hypothetical protein
MDSTQDFDHDDERCQRCLLRPEHCRCLPAKGKRTLRPVRWRRSGKRAHTARGVSR